MVNRSAARLGLNAAPPQRLNEDQIAAIVNGLGSLLAILREADPRDKAELYSASPTDDIPARARNDQGRDRVRRPRHGVLVCVPDRHSPMPNGPPAYLRLSHCPSKRGRPPGGMSPRGFFALKHVQCGSWLAARSRRAGSARSAIQTAPFHRDLGAAGPREAGPGSEVECVRSGRRHRPPRRHTVGRWWSR